VGVAHRAAGGGRPVADAPTAEVLGGGWYFATQVARVLPGALDAESGAALLRAARPEAVLQEVTP
jgi:energy-coupling factor transport system ATP-binding protein